jgi:hypothetical protein
MMAIACLCTAVVFGMANTIQAAPLLPGTAIPNDGAPAVAGAGTLLADTGYVPYSFGGGVNSGTIRQIVITDPSNPLGGVVFMHHIVSATGDLSSLNVSSYMNGGAWLTDASAVHTAIQNPLLPAATPLFAPGTTLNGVLDPADPTPISRSVDGTVVGFAYDKLITTDPYSTVVMIVRTNAPGFAPGGNQSIQDGFSGNITAFQPAPEPASMTLLGIGLVSLGGYAWRRRKNAPTQESATPAI